MSLDTWMQEFYPVRAEHAKDALEHSIQKWTGMLLENLKKHEVSLQYYSPGRLRVIENDGQDYLWVDSVTCALCAQHLRTSCASCPLTRVRGVRCYDSLDDSIELSPWRLFTRDKAVQPMLDLLLQAKEREGQ